jgi:hypothetical protein
VQSEVDICIEQNLSSLPAGLLFFSDVIKFKGISSGGLCVDISSQNVAPISFWEIIVNEILLFKHVTTILQNIQGILFKFKDVLWLGIEIFLFVWKQTEFNYSYSNYLIYTLIMRGYYRIFPFYHMIFKLSFPL